MATESNDGSTANGQACTSCRNSTNYHLTSGQHFKHFAWIDPYPQYNNGYGPQQAQNWPPNQNDNRRYTTVTVTNRGQNGNRDDVVQQTVLCGSTYFDGYRNRIARC